MGGLVIAVAQVRSVIPEPVHADTHAWRHKVPDVGFPQKNRSSGVRRPCEKSLGTPQKQIVTDQPAVTLLLTRRAATVFTSLAMSHGAQSIGSKVPNDA